MADSRFPSQSLHTAQLLDDPSGKPRRGIRQPVGQGLGAGPLDLEVAGLAGKEVRARLYPLPILFVELGAVGAVGGSCGGHREVDPDEPARVVEAQEVGHGRSPVAAQGAEALVAQPAHQLRHGPGDTPRVPPSLGGRPGEAEAGQRGAHDVKGVRGIARSIDGAAERLDDVEHLGHRAGPAVEDEQRQGVGTLGASVDEVDGLSFDDGDPVRPGIEPGLGGSPVESGGPVAAEVSEVVEVGAVVPSGARYLVRPARALEALP